MLLKSPRVRSHLTIRPSEERVQFVSPAIPWTVLLMLWTVGSVAAFTIANQRHLALTVAVPIAAAFLVELTFLVIVKRMVSLGPAVWFASGVAPYLVLTWKVDLVPTRCD